MGHGLTPDDAIARIADWKGKDVRWEELGGGITNHNYIVWVNGGWGNPGGGKYVLRVPGAGTDMFIDRDVERECMIEAARVGVAPPVVHIIEPEKAMAIEFVDGEVMHQDSIVGHPDRLKQVIDTVKVFHQNATFGNEIHLFDMIRKYTQIAKDSKTPWPDWIQTTLKAMDDVEAATARHPVPPAACHNDLLSENFIVDADGKMWIIDWEYGGMTDPYFDLLMLYKALSGVWWGVWAMIQHTVSQIDFDYMEWGRWRVARAEEVIADPDYKSWLAAV
jgi:thiamine kinase-like enzyme